ISVHEDTALTARLPHVRAGRVEIYSVDGRRLTEQADHPRGGFDNPFSRDELDEKFRRLARQGWDEPAVSELEGRCATLESLGSVGELVPILRGVRAR